MMSPETTERNTIPLPFATRAQVNLHALDSVVRVASCMGDKLEPVANTIIPAVCKNLASSNQQVR